MSTRAMYTFVDSTKDGGGKYHVYKHHDGYPEGAVQHISGLLRFAWELPRFEADEAAASFVAANKNEGGGVRLMHSGVWSEVAPGDLEYRYEIAVKPEKSDGPRKYGEQLWIKAWEVSCSYPEDKWTSTLIFDGTLTEMRAKYHRTPIVKAQPE